MKLKRNKKGLGFNQLFIAFSLIFLTLVYCGIKTCEKQTEKAQKKLEESGEKISQKLGEVGKDIERGIGEFTEKAPKRLIGDINLEFGTLCSRAKGNICNANANEYCDSDEIIEIQTFFGSRGNSVCCTTNCSFTAPYKKTSYPMSYVGGNIILTCAFQKGEDCKSDRYCVSEQWLKARDTKTCCKDTCIERVQHRDIFFEGVGYTTIERFSEGRFGVWYGQGVGDGFYELGKPNYAEARRIKDNEYSFTVEGKTHSFTVVQDTRSSIKIEPKLSGTAPINNQPVNLNNENVREIRIENMLYSPSTLSIKEGTTIIWINKDSVLHTVTFENGINSGSVSSGGRFSFEFKQKGDYPYSCSFHSNMKGIIKVE